LVVTDKLPLRLAVILPDDAVAAEGDPFREPVPGLRGVGGGRDGASELGVPDEIAPKVAPALSTPASTSLATSQQPSTKRKPPARLCLLHCRGIEEEVVEVVDLLRLPEPAVEVPLPGRRFLLFHDECDR
jgi:hypothetical protein